MAEKYEKHSTFRCCTKLFIPTTMNELKIEETKWGLYFMAF